MPDNVALKLPFQPMLNTDPIQVVRMADFYHEDSMAPHRHNFYMLYWTTRGTGAHCIDFREYSMEPGKLFFLHKNQVHQMLTYPADGWMILFEEVLFKAFLKHNPQQEQAGMFDYFNREPLVKLDEQTMQKYGEIAALLEDEVQRGRNINIIQHFLSILLLYSAEQHQLSHHFKQNPADAELMRKLKVLIDNHYKLNRDTKFYSEHLGVSPRKLNETTMETMGRLVTELINDRLLCEAEALLGTTAMPVKEISYDLGFADQAHFAYFFRKAKDQTPGNFRQQFQHF